MSIQYYENQQSQDSVRAIFGDKEDLEIYHDGSNSFILNTNGSLIIGQSSGTIALRPKTNEDGILILANGAVALYHDDELRFETSNAGASVNGDLIVAGPGTGSPKIQFTQSGSVKGLIQYLDTGDNFVLQSDGKFSFVVGSSTAFSIDTAFNAILGGSLTVNGGGQIILGGTGRIQGVDTVQDSTDAANKAYVDAHPSGITGSGSTNVIPLFTGGTTLGDSAMSQANIGTGSAKRISVTGARMTITGGGGDADGGTLNLTANSARLGIAINAYPGSIKEPEASLDVGKNARIRGSLNVGSTNEQYLFVSTTGDTPVGYVKMGYYGTGTDYDLSGGAQSSVQYTSGFSNGGKVCEDERIMTFKLTRSQIAGLVGAGQKTLIAQDNNFNYIVKEAYMYQVNSSGGEAPLFNSSIAIQYQSSHGGTTSIDNAFELGSTILNATRKKRKVMVFSQAQCAQVGLSDVVPRAAVVLVSTSSVSQSGSGTVDYYLRLRVKNIDFNDDIKNNSQLITVT